jgi:hypothetical protein
MSYLIPGLGQVWQGRVAKGLLFFFALYALFFYGLYLGNWQNVHVAPIEDPSAGRAPKGMLESVVGFLMRFHFGGQVCIGVAAWPAIIQNNHAKENPQLTEHPFLGRLERRPSIEETNNLLRRDGKLPDLGTMYTVIAGVLNILVIYDAFAGPAFLVSHGPKEEAA